MAPKTQNPRAPVAGPSRLRSNPPRRRVSAAANSASPSASPVRNRRQRSQSLRTTAQKQRHREKERTKRHNKVLLSSIATIEALLLASGKRKRRAVLAKYRDTYRFQHEDDYQVRAEKLGNHLDVVMRHLIKKMSLPLAQTPQIVFKQLPTYSDTLLKDLDLMIRNAIKKTFDFITDSQDSVEHEKAPERILRHTRLLCFAMDAYVPDITRLRLLPDSLGCCLNLMLFVVQNSYISQTKTDLKILEEAGADLSLGSDAADRLMVRLCYDASEQDADGEMMLNIKGTHRTLMSAAEKCGSSRFFRKSIDQLDNMKRVLGLDVEDMTDEEEVIFIDLTEEDSDYVDSDTSSNDGSTMDGVEYIW